MAIVPLQRVTLIGDLKDRDPVLLELQRLGCVHLVDLVNDGSKPQGMAIRAEDLKAAIAYLDSCPEKRPPPSRSTRRGAAKTTSSHGDVTRIAAEVLQYRRCGQRGQTVCLRRNRDGFADASHTGNTFRNAKNRVTLGGRTCSSG